VEQYGGDTNRVQEYSGDTNTVQRVHISLHYKLLHVSTHVSAILMQSHI